MKNFYLMVIACIGAIIIASCAARLAHAQPSSQTYSVPMCPTGGQDANGNPYVAPCGGMAYPLTVTVIGVLPPAPISICPPNPLTKKVPTLC